MREQVSRVLQPDIDVRGGLGLEQIEAPPRNLKEQSC